MNPSNIAVRKCAIATAASVWLRWQVTLSVCAVIRCKRVNCVDQPVKCVSKVTEQAGEQTAAAAAAECKEANVATPVLHGACRTIWSENKEQKRRSRFHAEKQRSSTSSWGVVSLKITTSQLTVAFYEREAALISQEIKYQLSYSSSVNPAAFKPQQPVFLNKGFSL